MVEWCTVSSGKWSQIIVTVAAIDCWW